ncbi:UvrD-helicase domain-containing protein [Moorella naiadis (nom. illeg.)]|uniref:UvrD-helicase domain-containing protein n=1 Tax=Moorella naiadis (nom. illeg.) TaxID=3093670 RepID=UPI003D9C9709
MATSKDANPENLYRWARHKGVTLVGSGDFTHPGWRQELRDKLEPAGDGLYRLKDELCRQVEEDPVSGLTPAGLTGGGNQAGNLEGAAAVSSYLPQEATGRPVVRFIISGEISTIYKQGGRTRKVHHLILLPGLEAAAKLSHRLEAIGNLHSDGRPILGLDSRRLLEMTLEACPEAIFIPAHIWTPHFSLFGANSGFAAMEECYGDLTRYIFAVETGLSSDPPMNWRLAALDRLTLVSNSDAHSPRHLAREANLFNTDLTYPAIRQALQDRVGDGFLGTLEFFPEEGKYHYDGHRNCQVCWQPTQTRAAGGICPMCGRKLTIGVLHRVEELADREAGFRPPAARPFESLIPLPEVIAAALGIGVASKRVTRVYFNLINTLGPELAVLREVPLEAIARVAGSLVATAIQHMRTGEVEVHPGFDGEYGKVFLMRPEERQLLIGEPRLFTEEATAVPAATRGDRPETVLPGPAGAIAAKFAPNPSVGGAPPVLAAPAERANRQPLNPEQQAAVMAADGPVVVVAGPGTGKTRTLVYRLAYLIKERGVDPGEIAAVTFTNKAAAEIRQRVTDLLGEREGVAALTVGTFHSICLDLLQAGMAAGGQPLSPIAQPEPADYHRSLAIIDEVDAREILAEVLVEDRGQGRRGVATLQRQLSLLKGRGLFPDAPEVPDDLRPLYRAYQERLESYGLIDYDDILLQALALPGVTPVAAGTAGTTPNPRPVPFTHLLVDEFQDVNAVQYQLVKKWAGDGENLFVIGDPDQAIYGFRGADYRFFGQLLQDFPAARLFYLHWNYRSTPVILKAAAGVIAHNPVEGPLAVTRAELAAAASGPAGALSTPGDGSSKQATTPVKPAATLKSPVPVGRVNPHVPQSGSLPLVDGAGLEVTAPNYNGAGLEGVHPQGSPIIYLEAPGETAAGIALVREIDRLVGGTTMLQAHGQGRGAKGGPEPGEGESYSFSDLAVLCRTGRQLEFLEECFLKEGLPYRIVGRESFLEAAPVRQALAFCRCLVNPADDFYLLQCLTSQRGINRETAARIGELARNLGVPAWQVISGLAGGEVNPSESPNEPATCRNHREAFPGEPATGVNHPGAFPYGPALRNRLQAFIATLTAYRTALEEQSPADLLARWAGERGLQEEESLARLIRVATGFADLPTFLRGVVLAGEADHERRGSSTLSSEVVTLMTLHAAKGLEFPVVFIAGLEEGVLPLRERQGANLTPEEMAEERRLFYVGMTRARELLYLVAARRREQAGAAVPAEPSPFLREIPAGCLVTRVWEAGGKSKGNKGEAGEDTRFKQLSLF